MSPTALRTVLAERGPAKALQGLVERVILDPELTCRIDYKALPGRSQWLGLASPRGFETWPPELTSLVRIA